MATPDESSPLRCCICFNSKEGRQPRALSCLHSFCNDCLKKWHEKRHREGHCAQTQVECPTCRTKTVLKSGVVSSLPMDINVPKFADYLTKESKSISCQLCKSKEGKVFCSMCSVMLCGDCCDAHKTSPLFASHVLTENICKSHGAPLQCVCTTCLCGVCFHCVHEDFHKGHALEEMSVGIKIIKQNVKKCTGELEEMLRTGNLDVSERRTYIEQFQGINNIKTTLGMIKSEVERLEKDVVEHETLFKAKMDVVFKEYETHSKSASAAILNGTKLLDEDDNVRVLDQLKTAELPNELMCSQLRAAVSSVPEFSSISLNKCRIEYVDDALDALANCKLVCGIPDVTAIPVTPAPPMLVMKIDTTDGWDMEDPGRLCGTPEGDIIVCNISGGPVYKVYKDGKKTRLLDDGIATCVDGSDVYVITKDGGTVTQIKQYGSTVKHKIKPPIPKPRGLAVSGDNVFILTYEMIIKQSLSDSHCRETITFEGHEQLRNLLKIYHGGMTKLIITNWDTHEVIICDEAGSVLTRFGGRGKENGLLDYPTGIGMMSNGHLLVANYCSYRIVEYKMDGTFVKNHLTAYAGVDSPRDVVFRYPYLWIADGHIKLYRFSE